LEVISPTAEAIMPKHMMNTIKRFIKLDIKQLNKEKTIFVKGQEAVHFLPQKNQRNSTEKFLAFIEMRLFITLPHS
jgi:hypothetical protein